jgi:hypothetical protein
MSRKVSSKFWVSLAFEGSMGGIYGAVREIRALHRKWTAVRTYIALVIHMGPVSAGQEHNMLVGLQRGTWETYIIEK